MLHVEEVYCARKGQRVPPGAGELPGGMALAAPSPFTIEVRFLQGLTDRQKDAFRAAADRWTQAIVGDLPAVRVEGETIDDVVILAQGVAIDGAGRVLGQAGPTHLRPGNIGAASFLPARGIMSFDTADLADMERQGTLNDVITHEMGHVLGIGTLWVRKELLAGSGTQNPVFTGSAAREAYGQLRNTSAQDVPVENTGGPGTAEGHWREIVFRTELMSGFISSAGNPMSKVTVASLEDLGYEVDMDAAEPFSLPDLMALAEAGVLRTPVDGVNLGGILPTIPVLLASGSVNAGS